MKCRPADGSLPLSAATLAIAAALGKKGRALTVLLRSLPLLAAALLALPRAAQAEEPVRPLDSAPDTFPPPAARGRVALAGLGITGGFYALSLGSSLLFSEAPGAESLQIPVAGPWMALAETGCRAAVDDCPLFPVVLRAVLTTVDGIAQAGGLAVAAESLWMPTRARKQTGLRVVPVHLGRAGVGFGVRARF